MNKMIILRKKPVVTLYHVTKKENVPSILREGLKGSKATSSANTASMKTGLPEKVLEGKVYLSRYIDKLGAMELNDKRVILKIEVPEEEFIRDWKDVGDPIRNSFPNKEAWARYYVEYVKKNKPEFLTKMGGEAGVRKLCLQVWDNVGPDKTMVLDRDIPAKYISVL